MDVEEEVIMSILCRAHVYSWSRTKGDWKETWDVWGWDAQGQPCGVLWVNGICFVLSVFVLPLSPNIPSEQPEIWKVISHESEPVIVWGSFTEMHERSPPPPSITQTLQNQLLWQKSKGSGGENGIPMEPKTMASLNVIKSIIK